MAPKQDPHFPAEGVLAKRLRFLCCLRAEFQRLGLEQAASKWLPQTDVRGKRLFERQAREARNKLRSAQEMMKAVLQDLVKRAEVFEFAPCEIDLTAV